MIDHDAVNRLVAFRSLDAPVLSVYVGVPTDPGQLVNAQTTFNSLLKQVRDLVASPDLTHAQRESLRADADKALSLGRRAPQFQGRGVAMFACSQAGLYEEITLPASVRNRAVVDARPYLRPLLALAQADPPYAVVVLDAKRSWLYLFHQGRLEEVSHRTDQSVRAHDFAGWYGLEEWSTHNRAEGRVRRHFRETAQAAEALLGPSGPRVLVLGGHEATLAQFLPYLSRRCQQEVAGTFVVDPHTMTTGEVREAAARVVAAYEHNQQTRSVTEVLGRLSEHGLAAAGIEWCLAAVNNLAVQTLLIHDEAQAPGMVCDGCGWLGLATEATQRCPVCNGPIRNTAEVIEEMAAAVLDAGGDIQRVHDDAGLDEQLVAASLRFPIPAPRPMTAAASGPGVTR